MATATATTPTGTGTVTYSNSGTAVDDYFVLSAATLTKDYDVMANDGGGTKTVMWSVDDGTQNQVTQLPTGGITFDMDLLNYDGVGGSTLSAGGALVTIDSTKGLVTYSLDASSCFYHMLQGLGADEYYNDKFVYAIKNANGTLSQATVTVHITGVNDAVSIVDGTTDAIGAVTEDSANPTLSDTGSIGFTDPDLTDTHTAVANAAVGNTLGGTLTLGSVSELSTTADGSVGWTYNVANAATQYLAAGQTVTENFDVAINDTHGSTAHQTVSVTVTGVNDDVTIVAGSTTATGAATEDSAATLTAGGTIAFTDPDLADTHTASFTANAGNALGGSLSLGSVSEAANAAGGTVGWTYSVNNANAAVQALALNQTATESFDVAIADGNGSTAHQTVSVTVTGVNDAPTDIGYSGNTSVAEHTAANTVLGTFSTTDVDVSDTHTYSILSGNTDGWFTIVGNQLKLASSPELSPEVNKTYTLDIQTSDGHAGGTYHETLAITVTNDPSDDVTTASLPPTFTGTGDPNDFDNKTGTATIAGLTGDSGDNTLVGTANSESIDGKGGNDVIYAGAGDDNINGSSGDDTLYGQQGIDTISGDSGSDAIYGGSGNDSITGGADSDTIYGGSGNDTINSGSGADTVIGGYGADNIDLGNDGQSDTLIYKSLNDTNDTISNFLSGQDKIDLSAIDSGALGGAFSFHAADIGGQYVEAHTVTWHASGGNVEVYADTDGVLTTAEFHITLSGIGSVQLGDFAL